MQISSFFFFKKKKKMATRADMSPEPSLQRALAIVGITLLAVALISSFLTFPVFLRRSVANEHLKLLQRLLRGIIPIWIM
jgi:hypothetical protein